MIYKFKNSRKSNLVIHLNFNTWRCFPENNHLDYTQAPGSQPVLLLVLCLNVLISNLLFFLGEFTIRKRAVTDSLLPI